MVAWHSIRAEMVPASRLRGQQSASSDDDSRHVACFRNEAGTHGVRSEGRPGCGCGRDASLLDCARSSMIMALHQGVGAIQGDGLFNQLEQLGLPSASQNLQQLGAWARTYHVGTNLPA